MFFKLEFKCTFISNTRSFVPGTMIKKPVFLRTVRQLTVPSLTYLPEALLIGRAVRAVRGVFIACSIVLGRPLCVLGLTNPVIGLPD